MVTDLDVATNVAVVGGGIAGAWAAYRLAQRGVRTTLVADESFAPSTSRTLSIGLLRPEAPASEEGPAAVRARYWAEEFEELARLVPYCEFNDLLRPGDPATAITVGAGDSVVAPILAAFTKLGGLLLCGRVTELVVADGRCYAVRYQSEVGPGVIRCGDVVLASGGFSGLFHDGVGTSAGALLGTYARCGGTLTNLEQFPRYAVGNLDRKIPHYPFQYGEPVRFLRDGSPAEELARMLATADEKTRELDVFREYWMENLDVPHTAVHSGGEFRVGPIRNFSEGGILREPGPSAPANVHATGECGHGLVAGWASGRPFSSYLVRGRELVDLLAEAPTAPPAGITAGDAAPGTTAALRVAAADQLYAMRDELFTVAKAERFIRWCRDERRRAGRDPGDVDLLILAEAHAGSVLARKESRGFFRRPDHPAADPALAHCRTEARYSAVEDEVEVVMVSDGD